MSERRPKRPRDPAQLAKLIDPDAVDLETGDTPEVIPDRSRRRMMATGRRTHAGCRNTRRTTVFCRPNLPRNRRWKHHGKRRNVAARTGPA
jgi:hypothetical protein